MTTSASSAHVLNPPPTAISPTSDFTFSAWLHTETAVGWPIGDLFSQYDTATRSGVALSCLDNTGGPTSQANRRHLSFFVDAGATPRWTDCGQPAGCRLVFSFAIHRGKLLAATNDAGPGGLGKLMEYRAPDQWIERGSVPDGCNSIQSLTVHQDQLYAVTGCYDGKGSALSGAANTTPGGNVYHIDDAGQWHDCGNPFREPAPNQCPTLFSFGNQLLLGSAYHPGVYIHQGGRDWRLLSTPSVALPVFGTYRGALYAAPKSLKLDMFPNLTKPTDHAKLYHLSTAQEWHGCGPMAGIGRIYTLAVHADQLFAGSWPEGRTARSTTGQNDWLDAGECGRGPLPNHAATRGEIMAMAHYHGELYVGTLPTAEVYRYDADHRWTHLRQLDATPGVPIRRTWTAVEYDGSLFFSTLPSGRVWRMDTGVGITAADPLLPGWRHIVATRHGDTLTLHVDGRCVAQRRDPLLRTLDLRNAAPLQFGKGRYSPLRGTLRHAQIHDHALNATELQTLAADRPAAP